MGTSNNIIIAAGGIVSRKGAQGPEIAVIHRSRYNDWSLPKGKPNAGESLEATALREVKEETGCDVKIAGFAGTIEYDVKGVPKVVFFWNMPVRAFHTGQRSYMPKNAIIPPIPATIQLPVEMPTVTSNAPAPSRNIRSKDEIGIFTSRLLASSSNMAR